jgi:diguanylate cyclase (GGDEF)-like protein
MWRPISFSCKNLAVTIDAKLEATLADTSPSLAQRRNATIVSLSLALAAGLMYANAKSAGPQLPTFAVAFYPVLAGIYLLIALLIDAEARWHCSAALVILAEAFLFVFAAVVAYLVVFPGAFARQGLVGATPHSSLWMWMFWHFGFAALIVAYAVLDTRKPRMSERTIRLCRLVLPVVVIAAVYLLLRLACASHVLPELRRGGSNGVHTTAFALLRLLLVFSDVAALGSVLWLTRCRSMLNLWLSVALWAQLLEVLLGIGGQARYSYGWYFSRLHGGTSALIILIVFLRSMFKLRDNVLRMNVELHHQASEDPLTGLANQRVFFEQLRRAVAQKQRHPTSLALLMLDVDHFKRYNDAYGHAAGNLCLQHVSLVMRTSARRPDDWVARIGGEEFAILLPNTGVEGARAVAANVIEKLQGLGLEHKASEFDRVTISIGAAVCDARSNVREEQLFEAADKALYKAKREGSTTVL